MTDEANPCLAAEALAELRQVHDVVSLVTSQVGKIEGGGAHLGHSWPLLCQWAAYATHTHRAVRAFGAKVRDVVAKMHPQSKSLLLAASYVTPAAHATLTDAEKIAARSFVFQIPVAEPAAKSPPAPLFSWPSPPPATVPAPAPAPPGIIAPHRPAETQPAPAPPGITPPRPAETQPALLHVAATPPHPPPGSGRGGSGRGGSGRGGGGAARRGRTAASHAGCAIPQQPEEPRLRSEMEVYEGLVGQYSGWAECEAWRTLSSCLPQLAQRVRKLLAVQPTEADAERAFKARKSPPPPEVAGRHSRGSFAKTGGGSGRRALCCWPPPAPTARRGRRRRIRRWGSIRPNGAEWKKGGVVGRSREKMKGCRGMKRTASASARLRREGRSKRLWWCGGGMHTTEGRGWCGA